MRDMYVRNGHGFILAYSILAQSTFNDIPDLHRLIVRVKDSENVPTVLVGNKCDMTDQRVISTAQGDELAQKYHIPFFETSALANLNIESAFHSVVRQIRDTNRNDLKK